MDKGNNLLLLLISLFIINFLISNNLNDDGKAATTVFAQETTTAGQFSTYTNEKYGITMQYPSDWTKEEGEDENTDEDSGDIRIVAFSKDPLYSEGDVSLYINPGYIESLEDYLINTIEYYEEEKDGFEIISSSAHAVQTLSENPAYILEYMIRDDDDETLDTRYMEIGTKIGDDNYFVEYSAYEDDSYFNSLPIAQKMIDSIKIGTTATSSLSSQSHQQLQPQPAPQLQPQPAPQLQSVPRQPQQQLQQPQQQLQQPQQQLQQPQQQLQQPQNLNNLNQQQLVDLIASTISNANNIDKNKVIQAINDMIELTKTKGGNVIDSLKKIAGVVLKDPSGTTANKIMNIANKK